MEKDRESWGVGVRRLEEADGMKIVVFLLLRRLGKAVETKIVVLVNC